MLNRLFSFGKPKAAVPSTDGRLVYAVGDVHGRLDLLTELLSQITEDAARTQPEAPPALVFIGDYVDRGPESRGVIELLRRLKARPGLEVRTLMGNHEEVMLSFLDDVSVGASWVEFGGGQTLAAYGVAPPPSRADAEAWEAAQLAFRAAIPPDHVAFLRELELSATYGDYLFVHAGVRPGVRLEDQDRADLLWIREAFLTEARPFAKVVVHGHTPEVKPHSGPVRIGVDTGAYATGVLTAARLYGEERSFLQTSARHLRH